MARPTKVGLEYFGLDVNMDDEVELIKAQHGMKGFGILITMFQTIYGDKGYYYKWNKRNQLLFTNKVSDDINTVKTVINDCINWDIFHQEKYKEYNILTSKRIQKQYISATYKRKEVELIEEYLVVKKGDIDRSNITCISVSDVNNPSTSDNSDNNNKQSKVKYSKVKESILNNKITLVRNFSKFPTNRFKKVLPPSERPKFDKDSTPYKAAVYLRNKILENNSRQPVPDENPKDLEKWAIELERLNRLGPIGAKEHQNKGYTWKEIGKIMDWCQDDPFWKNNILSAPIFREKITQLENKMNTSSKNKKSDMLKELYAEAQEENQQEQEEVDVL